MQASAENPLCCDFASALMLQVVLQAKGASVLALQFGDGLDFFDALTAWQRIAQTPNQRLEYLAICETPPDFAALQAACVQSYPDAEWLPALLAQWPEDPQPGFHLITLLDQRVQLTLIVYPALKALVELDAQVAAIFFDASTAPQNAELRSRACLIAATRQLAQGGTLAVWQIDAAMARELLDVGLSVYAKTESLSWFSRQNLVKNPRAARPKSCEVARPERIAIVGAGIAGLSLAFALAQRAKTSARAVNIEVFEAQAEVFQSASAAPLVLLHPASGSRDSIEFNLQSHSFRAAIRQLRALKDFGDADWMQAMPVHELRKNGRSVWHQGFVLESKGLSAALIKALSALGVSVQTCAEVAQIQRDSAHGFSLAFKTQAAQTAGALYLCNARAAHNLLPELRDLIDPIRGQLELLARGAAALDFGYCGALNVLPGRNQLAIGNSFEPFKQGESPDENVRKDLISRAQTLLGIAELAQQQQASWVGFRAQAIDRLPLVGKLPNNVSVSLAHGSKGFSSGFLAAEILTAMHFGDAPVVPARVGLAMQPGRFKALDALRLG
jgi:tRNA 5-methylaminomethyl-2-thiouridine biosynthesis bifunctional protein